MQQSNKLIMGVVRKILQKYIEKSYLQYSLLRFDTANKVIVLLKFYKIPLYFKRNSLKNVLPNTF